MDNQIVKINAGDREYTLEFLRELGRGAFGSVHLAIDEHGEQVAVKKSTCINNETYIAATQEIQILVKLDHVNIAKLVAVDFHMNNALIVMEYCDGGDLNNRLNDPVSEDLKLQWIKELIDSLRYLHWKKIIHRDLKPENVLLKNEVIKLTDFGISKFYYGQGSCPDNENNLSHFMGTFAGTPYWVAPEMFDQRYTDKADLFSLGVICYAILHAESMVYDNKKYYGVFVPHTGGRLVGLGLAMSEQDKEIEPSKTYDDNLNLNDVVVRLLRKNPDARISLEDAKEFISVSPGDSREEDENEDAGASSLSSRDVNDDVDLESGNGDHGCEENQVGGAVQQDAVQQDAGQVVVLQSLINFVVYLLNFVYGVFLRILGRR